MADSSYITHMRKEFCTRDMIDENGELKPTYFIQKSGACWSTNDTQILLKSLQNKDRNWEAIAMNFSPPKKPCEVRLQAEILEEKKIEWTSYSNTEDEVFDYDSYSKK